MSNADMDLTALKHGGLFTTKGLMQFHVHIGKAFSVSRQECRQDAFDRVRWGSHLQYPAISAPQQRDPLAQRADIGQNAAAICEQVFADGRQNKAAPDTVEKLEAKLLLEVADLSRKG